MADFSSVFFLLLPVAAASGWYAARRSAERSSGLVSSSLSTEYFKGLNYLLNEQQDKAIEVFLHMTEIDKDTVEIHVTLGDLFRRRGEVDRAIRIHQNLIARETLSDEQRVQAVLALGKDYLCAGLLDRAENLFKEVIQQPGKHIQSLGCLISIYEQEKDWVSAIEVTRELSHQTGENFGRVIAQYFCELAEQALERSGYNAAMRYLERALSMDPNCVRATLLFGRIYEKGGEYQKSIQAYKKVEKQDIEYVSEVIDSLLSCYARLGRPYEVMPYLSELTEKSTSLSPMLAQADLIQRRDGNKASELYLIEQLRRRPSIRGFDKLINVHLLYCAEGARDYLIILRGLMQALLEKSSAYNCIICGFKGRLLHWQCPSCKTWHAIKPAHSVEGE